MADKRATREAYGEALAKLGQDHFFYVMDADLSASTKTAVFAKAFPDRFINCGIAEGNMMSVAAGIASTGVPVFASTFAMFAAGRAFEQIRNSIGYPALNVKICATHAGITVGEDGATHQCNEDIALMRSIPGMTVLCPADSAETAAAVEAALGINGPVYIRLGRYAVPEVTAGHPFAVGRGQILREGSDVTLCATGVMTSMALEAADLLLTEGISARVVNMATIKPIDAALLADCARKTGAIVTCEEHTVLGGLGGAVAEAVCESCPVPVLRVGVEDTFGRSGTVPELLTLYGLTSARIAEKARAAVKMKR